MRIRHRRAVLYILAVLIICLTTSCATTPAPPSAESPQIVVPPVVSVAAPEVSDEPASPSQSPEEIVEAEISVEMPDETPDETPVESPNDENPDETSDEVAEVLETPDETPSEPVTYPEPDPGKVAYLTIDDGPSRAITPAILDLLAAEGIKATFFVLPHSGVDDIYQRIIDEGHELANHSYSHVYKKLYNPDDLESFKEDVLAARSFIYDNFGYYTTAFRFPGGAMSRSEEIIAPRKELLAELGYRWFDWHLTTGDADSSGSGKDSAILTANVLDNIRGRDRIIILMHDTSDKKATLEALPAIIAGLRERGYGFDVISNYPDE